MNKHIFLPVFWLHPSKPVQTPLLSAWAWLSRTPPNTGITTVLLEKPVPTDTASSKSIRTPAQKMNLSSQKRRPIQFGTVAVVPEGCRCRRQPAPFPRGSLRQGRSPFLLRGILAAPLGVPSLGWTPQPSSQPWQRGGQAVPFSRGLRPRSSLGLSAELWHRQQMVTSVSPLCCSHPRG